MTILTIFEAIIPCNFESLKYHARYTPELCLKKWQRLSAKDNRHVMGFVRSILLWTREFTMKKFR